MCNALHYLLGDIFIRFGSKLYRQIVGIPMGTNWASLVADLFLFFMRETSCCLFLTIIKLMLLNLNSTSRYQNDFLNIDYPYLIIIKRCEQLDITRISCDSLYAWM